MPQIIFRGKSYTREFEMPQDVRRAYQEYQMQKSSKKSLTDVVDMPDELKAVYRRAWNREQQSGRSESTNELLSTEELYRQSAPGNLKHLPPEERMYRHSPPVIDPEYSTIEPESGLVLRGLVFGILWSLLLIAIVFLVVQFLMQVF
jgi:hypothetical protein